MPRQNPAGAEGGCRGNVSREPPSTYFQPVKHGSARYRGAYWTHYSDDVVGDCGTSVLRAATTCVRRSPRTACGEHGNPLAPAASPPPPPRKKGSEGRERKKGAAMEECF